VGDDVREIRDEDWPPQDQCGGDQEERGLGALDRGYSIDVRRGEGVAQGRDEVTFGKLKPHTGDEPPNGEEEEEVEEVFAV
jgi:hypothetical protein